MRRALAVAAALALAACRSAPPHGSHAPQVELLGSFQAQMAAGKCDEGIAVRDLLARPHAYAIGPIAGLRGELLVWDGTAFTSTIVDGAPRVRIDPGARGAFLVASHVARWRDLAVPESVRTLAELTAWLPEAAQQLHLDPERTQTLRLFAALDSARLHVADLAPGAPLDHAAHAAAQHVVDLGPCLVQLLGFLSPPGESTCPIASPPLHLHLRTLLGDMVGHVEELQLAPGAKVEFAVG